MESNLIPNNREYYLDNLKILLALFVVIAHVLLGYTFLNTPYMVHKEEILATVSLQYFYCLCKVFLMESFYFIAGYFFYLSLTRFSIYDIFKKRLLRYGIPIILYQIIFHIFFEDCVPGTWFLEILLIITIFFLLIHRMTQKYLFEIQMSLWKILLCGFVVGLSLGVSRKFFHFGSFISVPFMHIEFAQIPKYFVCFYMGILANKNRWIDNLFLSKTNYYGIIITASIITIIGFVFRSDILNHLNSFPYAIFDGLQCLTIVFSLLLIYRKWFNFSNKILRFASKQVMSIYLINSLFIYVLQILLYDVEISLLIKICVLFVVSLILTIISSCLLKKIPLIRISL